MAFDPLPHYSATYAEAREKFRASALARDLCCVEHVHPAARGAHGEALAIDVASIGPPADAPGVLLLTSGTHGAEGFCGSGCQVALLHDTDLMAEVLASGMRVVLLHALNPYGFSHLRRTNEDNVDLNRNFRDFAQPLPPNTEYAAVHALVVPPEWPPTADNEARLFAYAAEHGERALQAAISGGQCEFPDGLFYGGVRAAWSNGDPA